MSGYPLGLLRQAVERCSLDVVISYGHYNLQNTRLLTELLPAAEAHGVGVLNASPLAMGLLTNQGPQPWFTRPAGGARGVPRRGRAVPRPRGGHQPSSGCSSASPRRGSPASVTGTAKRAELEVEPAGNARADGPGIAGGRAEGAGAGQGPDVAERKLEGDEAELSEGRLAEAGKARLARNSEPAGPVRRPVQPPCGGFLRAAVRGRQVEDGGPRGVHAEAPDCLQRA